MGHQARPQFRPYPYDLADGLPVPLAISAMLAVEILGARSDVERSEVVHRYAHHIAEAMGPPIPRLPARCLQKSLDGV